MVALSYQNTLRKSIGPDNKISQFLKTLRN